MIINILKMNPTGVPTLKKISDKCGGVLELANASNVHSSVPGSNLVVEKNSDYLCISFEFKSVGC